MEQDNKIEKKPLEKQPPIILEAKNISKTYQAKNGEIQALKDINFKVKQGEYISIIGPSGCGKSTLLSIIAGLESKSQGTIINKRRYLHRWDNRIYVTKRQLARMENNLQKRLIRIRNTKK